MKDLIEARKIFADRVKSLMINKDLSIRKLAKEIDAPHSTISCWLNESNTPPINAVIALAEYFGVTTDYLLGLEN